MNVIPPFLQEIWPSKRVTSWDIQEGKPTIQRHPSSTFVESQIIGTEIRGLAEWGSSRGWRVGGGLWRPSQHKKNIEISVKLMVVENRPNHIHCFFLGGGCCVQGFSC